jgi:hypothetical protein
VLGLVAVITAAAVPQALASLDHDRAVVAARYVASRMRLARMQAVSRSATVALRFDEGAQTTALASFIDGNHDGVRTQEIHAGVDRLLDAAVPLGSLFPGGLGSHAAVDRGDAVGRPDVRTLVSFTPAGTASSRSVYVTGRDGSRYAVRVLGATGRTLLERYEPSRGRWLPVF